MGCGWTGPPDQRTAGPADHRTTGLTNHRATGPPDHRTTARNPLCQSGRASRVTRRRPTTKSLLRRGCRYHISHSRCNISQTPLAAVTHPTWVSEHPSRSSMTSLISPDDKERRSEGGRRIICVSGCCGGGTDASMIAAGPSGDEEAPCTAPGAAAEAIPAIVATALPNVTPSDADNPLASVAWRLQD